MKTYKHEKFIKIYYILIDGFLIFFSMFLSFVLRYRKNYSDLSIISQYVPIFILGSIITISFLYHYGLYTTNRDWSYGEEIFRVFKALSFSFLPTACAVFFLQTKLISRIVFINSWIFMFILLLLWRVIKRAYLHRLVKKGFNNFNVLLIGTGRTSSVLINEIKQNPFLGLKIIGFLDDDLPKGTQFNGYTVLGKINDLKKTVQKKFIDTIFVTVPHSREMIHQLMTDSKKLSVSLRVVPDYYDFLLGDVNIHRLGFIPTFEYHSRTIHGSDLIFKRIFDVLCSMISLIILFPLFIIIGIAIKLDSPGPVFYISKRCGRKERIFNFCKFRTMIHDADLKLELLRELNEKKGPIFKIKDDPRITKVGRLLRKYSLDELPQLWNVLKGDMSLVGPRPPIPEEVEKYDHWHMQRLIIRPGITCLWQTRGRSNLSFRHWMKLDMFYIENWSFWLDIKILFKTISVVLKGQGAY